MGSTIPQKDSQLDEVNITSRLLNLLFDMPVAQKLELLKTLDDWGHAGSRKNHRKNLVIPIDYSTEDRSFKDVIKDISSSGLFIETRMPFTTGRDIKMKFRLNKGRKFFQIAGEIVRVTPQGIGVKFKKSEL